MFTLEEQISEVKREVVLRKACYPAWVKHGKLTQAEAARQLQLMIEVLKTLHRLDGEQRQMSLCGREG
jgi:polyhydroxyalkanoate synthesis regulator phasin